MKKIVSRLAVLSPAFFLIHCSSPNVGPGGAGPSPAGTTAVQGNHGPMSAIRVAAAARPLGNRDHQSAALAFSREQGGRFGISDSSDFVVTSDDVGVDGLHHIRLQQTHQGIKVWGADIVVHATATHVQGLGGTVAPALTDLETTPSVAAPDARNIAVHHRFGDDLPLLSREEQQLVVWLDQAQVTHLAWHIVFFNELQGGIQPGLWNYFVDAHTGEILGRHDGVHTETIDYASGPGGTPNYAHSWRNALEVTPDGSQFTMDTPFQKTMNFKQGLFFGDVVTGTLDAIGDAPINDAHAYGNVTLKMLKDWQGFDSIDGKGFKLVSRVHYWHNFENAFWDGQEMTYGDGDKRFYPLSGSVDVCAHEINHGFTQFHGKLDASDIGSALNESFSDIAGMTTSFYYAPERADFDLGKDVSMAAGKAIRYMCDPKADSRSVDNVADITWGMDPHLAAGPQNKAFCLASKRLASGDAAGKATQASVKRASNAWYAANAHYWTSSTDYQAACQGVLDAAKSLDFSDKEVAYLVASWADVGVNCTP